ncbi:LPO_1073/Vpar_1526 family protein [Mycolicibacterium sp. OfavD-34-C]|uniref:LPO_1073/Vpar_1526 family protein n=1 Tax=Mycolicibacterium sp. OfavD-34-C TaxID=2917746 RepID=UPI001EF3F3D5|nr:LPO_1073/Vpar_1526 family protein [Mycolicibacterium sp. OfavD-34-C]MCG7579385.1 hypothetical protein [Mycolicibacterium sp. OfavD-34-C]
MRRELGQAGGDGSTNFQSGRDIAYHGLTVSQLDELKRHVNDQVAGEVELFVNRQLETIRSDFVRFTGEAHAQAMATAQQLVTTFVEQLTNRAPENIASMKTPSMQQAILNATTSAAVADDDELTETLVGILVDKSGEGPRSFKGVVLNEALEVAGKLTSDQISLLTALVILARTILHGADNIGFLLALLDKRCRPLYGKLPTNKSAVQYAAYTGVGTEGVVSQPLANHIMNTYDAVFTRGFTADQLPGGMDHLAMKLPSVDPRCVIDPEGPARLRLPISSTQSLDMMKANGQLNEPYLTHIDEFKSLISNNKLPQDKVMKIIEAERPDLSKFIREIDELNASTFRLTSVGVAIGQANWRRIDPEAPDVDIYLV